MHATANLILALVFLLVGAVLCAVAVFVKSARGELMCAAGGCAFLAVAALRWP